MASNGFARILVPVVIGVSGGYYIFNQPIKDLTGKAKTEAPTEGRSQSVKDGAHKDGVSSGSPNPSMRDGTAPGSTHDGPTVAGTSTEGRKGNSADHNIQTRSNAKEQDGSEGGGQGLAEMRERKMKGQGLPSKQGGDTKAQPVMATSGEYGGMPKQAAK